MKIFDKDQRALLKQVDSLFGGLPSTAFNFLDTIFELANLCEEQLLEDRHRELKKCVDVYICALQYQNALEEKEVE